MAGPSSLTDVYKGIRFQHASQIPEKMSINLPKSVFMDYSLNLYDV